MVIHHEREFSRRNAAVYGGGGNEIRIHVDFDWLTGRSLDTLAFSGERSGVAAAHGNLVLSRVIEPSGFFTMLR